MSSLLSEFSLESLVFQEKLFFFFNRTFSLYII